MPGFRNISEWAHSAENGRNWISQFRKVPAVTTIAGQWFDFSTAAGNPVPNYYASAPLVADVLESRKGIYPGADVAPAKKFLHRLTVMNGAATATTTNSQNLGLYLLDYLLYYPFIDMDAAGEDQVMDNTRALPRYTDGKGVMMMLVAQAQTIGGGAFTVSYTNQDGVAGRVTPACLCAAAQPYGALVSAVTNAAGVCPFIPLQEGDTGVRSVESINFSVANGGLAALVLVRPLERQHSAEESRRTTTGTVESFGSAVETEAISMRAGAVQIQDGAYLNFIGQTIAGTIAGMQLVGTLETVWR